MKLRNIILSLFAVFVVAASLAVYYVYSSIDELVRLAIEQYGSEITGTSVTVQAVEIGLTEGRGTIRGFRMSHPPGYPSGAAVSFGEITLDIDVASLSEQKPVVIEVVQISAPSVSLVMNAEGGSNLQDIQKNANDYLPAEEAGEEPEPAGEPTLLSIRKLTVEDGRLAADLTAMGGSSEDAKLPPLRMSDVGGSRGLPPAEIGKQVATTFVSNVLSAVAKSQVQGQMNKLIDEKLGDDEGGKAAKGVLKRLFK